MNVLIAIQYLIGRVCHIGNGVSQFSGAQVFTTIYVDIFKSSMYSCNSDLLKDSSRSSVQLINYKIIYITCRNFNRNFNKLFATG